MQRQLRRNERAGAGRHFNVRFRPHVLEALRKRSVDDKLSINRELNTLLEQVLFEREENAYN